MAKLIDIFISTKTGEPMISKEEVRAIKSTGLEGDRYSTGQGIYSGDPVWDSSVTLISIEAFRAFESEFEQSLSPESLRRNLVTEGIDLNTLVRKNFRIGEVSFYGIKPWPPCSHIAAQVPDAQAMMKGFGKCGGIGVEVMSDGVVRRGDAILIID